MIYGTLKYVLLAIWFIGAYEYDVPKKVIQGPLLLTCFKFNPSMDK